MEIDIKKTVGQRLQLLRLEKNLTQEQMGEKLNLSTSAYCKIEYGETDLTLTRLYRIAEVLEMPALALFRQIDNSPLAPKGYEAPPTVKNDNKEYETNQSDLRELVKANSRLIDLLCKRMDSLEGVMKQGE